MVLGIFLIVTALTAGLFTYSLVFWLMLNREIKLTSSLRLSAAASALNKLLITGSGYAAVSGKLKNSNIPLHKSVVAFMLSEIFIMVPWLVCGLYFGAKAAVKIPVFLAFFLLLAFFAVLKRKAAISFSKEALVYVKTIKAHLPLVVPLVFLNIAAGAAYYFILFRIFAIKLPLREIFKIISVSVTAGYLSPSPSGLGFREGSIVFLLMQKGIAFNRAFSIALLDRLAVTGFYIATGAVCAAEILLDVVKKRHADDFS